MTEQTGKKVLIIEDEKPLAKAVSLKLESLGIATEVANNGEEGLKKVDEGKYDLILTDLVMPHMDGFAFLEKMKGKTPVVVLTNLSQTEDEQKVKELGATAYFVKADTPISDIVEHVKQQIL